jgi:hypothetical protein
MRRQENTRQPPANVCGQASDVPAVDLVGLGGDQCAGFAALARCALEAAVPHLHAELVNRMAFGNKVIDHERVTGLRETAKEVAAIYEVVNALISENCANILTMAKIPRSVASTGSVGVCLDRRRFSDFVPVDLVCAIYMRNSASCAKQ